MTGRFTNQGELSTSGTIIHTAPENNVSEIRLLRFNNPTAYRLIVSKYTSSTATTTQVYQIDLSDGDVKKAPMILLPFFDKITVRIIFQPMLILDWKFA